MVNCAQIEPMLDALMDGGLSDAARAELEAHCAACPACAGKLRATLALERMLSETAPEADVPLAVQAAWRGAVAAEAGRVRRRRLTRWAGGIAAALLVAVGSFFALKPSATTAPELAADQAMGAAMKQSVAVVEADGQDMAFEQNAVAVDMAEAEYESCDEAAPETVTREMSLSVGFESATAMPAANAVKVYERRMTVEDLDRTCAYMADLVSEYEGSMSKQRFEADGAACASLSIELPAGNAADFLNAAAHYDTGGAVPEIPATEGCLVSLRLMLTERGK